jgi:hypothetical protein
VSDPRSLLHQRKPECLYPERDGGRCCECIACQWQPEQARRILVTGPREWDDEETIRGALRPYIDALSVRADEPTIVHGDCRGADRLAAYVALDLGFWVESHPADWAKHGKRAGILRNLQMLDTGPDVVIAFRLNGSRGTTHMIEAAKARGVPVVVFGD